MTDSSSASDLDEFRPRARRRVRLAGLLAALSVALLIAIGGNELPSRRLFDTYQRLAPRDLSDTPVHVVWIDQASVSALGAWPWPRYYLARLTERLGAFGARTIAYDVLFAEPDRMNPDHFASLYPELEPGAAAAIRSLPAHDQDFSDAIGRIPRVVLGRAGISEPMIGPDGTPIDDREAIVEALFKGPLPRSTERFPHLLTNIPELDDVAVGHGLLNGEPDADGVVRRVLLAAEVAGRPMPGFAMEAARVATGTEEIQPLARSWRLSALSLGARRVPVDADGRMRIRFGAFPAAATTSAVDVLRAGFDGSVLRDKIVLVGLASEGSQDVVPTPLQTELFGILVQAQAVDALLRGGWLSRPAWAPAAEWLLGALLVGLIIAGGTRRRWRRLITVAVPVTIIGIIAASFLSFAAANLLLDPVKPLALGLAAAVGVIVMASLEAQRAQQRLREALLVERLGSAEAAGELQAARSIQIGMLPASDVLDRLHPELDIAGSLEPARSVGGDFYDAMRLRDGTIGFILGDVTGKGVPAALFMALSKALAKSNLMRAGPDLGDAAMRLDEELSRDAADEAGVTMLLGAVDAGSGTIRIVNAGHENPLRRTADGRVEEVALDGGPPFCVAPGFPYPEERIGIAPGESLILLTDGVTEAQNASGELFGKGRLIEALATARGDSRAIVDHLLAAVRAFEGAADPSDDLTMLVISRRA